MVEEIVFRYALPKHMSWFFSQNEHHDGIKYITSTGFSLLHYINARLSVDSFYSESNSDVRIRTLLQIFMTFLLGNTLFDVHNILLAFSMHLFYNYLSLQLFYIVFFWMFPNWIGNKPKMKFFEVLRRSASENEINNNTSTRYCRIANSFESPKKYKVFQECDSKLNHN